MSISLLPSSVQLLQEILSVRAPDLLPLIPNDGMLQLSDEQRLKISQALAREFVARGLQENDEPNEHGRHVEGLIDEINRTYG